VLYSESNLRLFTTLKRFGRFNNLRRKWLEIPGMLRSRDHFFGLGLSLGLTLIGLGLGLRLMTYWSRVSYA